MSGKWRILFMGGCLSLLICPPLVAEETQDRGQSLYENQCRFCHESEVHLRTDRHVVDAVELRKRVAAWSWHAALGWSDAEVDDVVDYLNRRFYHFPARSAPRR